MFERKSKTPWYIAGLHFECIACGSCCAGPEEGYIWITKPEVAMLAKYLRLSLEAFSLKFLKRVGVRSTIIEEPVHKDCTFLTKTGTSRTCCVYPVRPNQCRTWPFWPCNLESPNDWNAAATRCPGINRGRFYSFDKIERIKNQKKWWPDEK